MHLLNLFTQYLLIAEALAAFTGFITWNKWKHHYLKWFILYIGMIVFLESIASLFIYFQKDDEVVFFYQMIVVPFEILFINWFFYKTLAAGKRKIIIAGCIAYVISWLSEKTIFTGTGYYFQSISYTVGNLFILVYLILFFTELVNSDKLLHFKKLAVFWVASGMLIFYLGTFPFYGLYNELAKNLDIFIPAAWVATSLNYSMYFLFTIGLIWGKPD